VQRTYPALDSHALPAGTTFRQPVLPPSPAVGYHDPATGVMTDFEVVRAITVPPSVTMDYARERMRANRVHLLLVTDEANVIVGLITSTDIEGERPLMLMGRLGIGRGELTVADVMTPRARIEVIELDDVLRASVGHVVATLKAVGRQHAMVIDRDATGRPIVCGLFAASQLNRQLGEPLHSSEIARSFAEVEMALAGH
jgi:CBS domain containing-hemolysin-like protein